MRVRFADFLFDTISGQLSRDDRPVRLSGTEAEVLRVLVERRPRMVTKEDLLRLVWHGTAVQEANLSVAVAKLRQALGDDVQQPRFIRTYHRQGYSFVADAAPAETGEHERSGTASVFLLEWNDRRMVLNEGENIVGRNPLRSSICIDEPRVSGRHARIVVSGDSAIIEDLESTNHTFVGGVRVTGTRPLASGDVIQFGSPTVTFRRFDVPTVRVKSSPTRR